ncbi:MAG: hypothetical protein NVSMB65_00670 [Chloroflexota bacterium]
MRLAPPADNPEGSMPEFTAFLDRFRHDLGKKYSVAHQHTASNAAQVYVLVRRQGMPHTLSLVMETHWIIRLAVDAPRGDTRVEYKHLAVLVRRYFDAPAALLDATFIWPGSPETRETVRRALDPRQPRRG